MPYKAKKPCARNGCAKLTSERYCAEHAKEEAKYYNHYKRDPASNKRYDRAWARIREAFLQANPLCEICRQEGLLQAATLVHHKVRLKEGGRNDWKNLQALCAKCHARLHAREGDYF